MTASDDDDDALMLVQVLHQPRATTIPLLTSTKTNTRLLSNVTLPTHNALIVNHTYNCAEETVTPLQEHFVYISHLLLRAPPPATPPSLVIIAYENLQSCSSTSPPPAPGDDGGGDDDNAISSPTNRSTVHLLLLPPPPQPTPHSQCFYPPSRLGRNYDLL